MSLNVKKTAIHNKDVNDIESSLPVLFSTPDSTTCTFSPENSPASLNNNSQPNEPYCSEKPYLNISSVSFFSPKISQSDEEKKKEPKEVITIESSVFQSKETFLSVLSAYPKDITINIEKGLKTYNTSNNEYEQSETDEYHPKNVQSCIDKKICFCENKENSKSFPQENFSETSDFIENDLNCFADLLLFSSSNQQKLTASYKNAQNLSSENSSPDNFANPSSSQNSNINRPFLPSLSLYSNDTTHWAEGSMISCYTDWSCIDREDEFLDFRTGQRIRPVYLQYPIHSHQNFLKKINFFSNELHNYCFFSPEKSSPPIKLAYTKQDDFDYNASKNIYSSSPSYKAKPVKCAKNLELRNSSETNNKLNFSPRFKKTILFFQTMQTKILKSIRLTISFIKSFVLHSKTQVTTDNIDIKNTCMFKEHLLMNGNYNRTKLQFFVLAVFQRISIVLKDKICSILIGIEYVFEKIKAFIQRRNSNLEQLVSVSKAKCKNTSFITKQMSQKNLTFLRLCTHSNSELKDKESATNTIKQRKPSMTYEKKNDFHSLKNNDDYMDFYGSSSPYSEAIALELNLRDHKPHYVLHLFEGVYVYRVDCINDFYTLGPTLGLGGEGYVRMCIPTQIILALGLDPKTINWNNYDIEKQQDKFNEALSLWNFTYAMKITPRQRWKFDFDVYSMAHFIGALNHSNVLNYRALYEDPLNHCFLMDLVEGPALLEYLTTMDSVTEEQCRELFQQILEALSYIHKQHVIHRDIKPENFVCELKTKTKTSTNHVVPQLLLIDFGLACHIDDITNVKPDGTPTYMAPEMFLDNAYAPYVYDERVDIWAAGVILCQLLTGRTPFDEKGPASLIEKVNQADLFDDTGRSLHETENFLSVTPATTNAGNDNFDELFKNLLETTTRSMNEHYCSADNEFALTSLSPSLNNKKEKNAANSDHSKISSEDNMSGTLSPFDSSSQCNHDCKCCRPKSSHHLLPKPSFPPISRHYSVNFLANRPLLLKQRENLSENRCAESLTDFFSTESCLSSMSSFHSETAPIMTDSCNSNNLEQSSKPVYSRSRMRRQPTSLFKKGLIKFALPPSVPETKKRMVFSLKNPFNQISGDTTNKSMFNVISLNNEKKISRSQSLPAKKPLVSQSEEYISNLGIFLDENTAKKKNEYQEYCQNSNFSPADLLLDKPDNYYETPVVLEDNASRCQKSCFVKNKKSSLEMSPGNRRRVRSKSVCFATHLPEEIPSTLPEVDSSPSTPQCEFYRMRLDFEGEEWSHITSEAKDLVRSLLTLNPRKRPTAEEALNHDWFNTSSKPSITASNEELDLQLKSYISGYGSIKMLFKNVLPRDNGTTRLSFPSENFIPQDVRDRWKLFI